MSSRSQHRPPLQMSFTSASLFLLLTSTAISSAAAAAAASSASTPLSKQKNLDTLDYDIFPTRTSSEAAVVEWGHSAVISALDAVVASFGPQTSRGAFFEVETAPILADPVDGIGNYHMNEAQQQQQQDSDETKGDTKANQKDKEIPEGEVTPFNAKPLKNSNAVHGNMVVMTNTANLSGVTMAAIAKASGAAALMVVNVDQNNPDFIYKLEPESEEEAKYAEDNIDFPVIMVSLNSANVLTTATVTEGMKKEDIVNNGMPERVRLYAGGDRPFFEDVIPIDPTVYLIHNLLTEEECDSLIKAAENKLDPLDDTVTNILENTIASEDGKPRTRNLQHVTLWKGSLHGHAGKQIEERIEQVTAFPKEHYSDFQITKHVVGSYHGPHYDLHPTLLPMATITIFLNDLEEDSSGGEVIYPVPGIEEYVSNTDKDGQDLPPHHAVKIKPRKGMAVIHHNTDEEYNFDATTLHAELELRGGVKYIAKKWVYTTPLPPSRRIALPLLAFPFGGKLPRFVIALHDLLIRQFGLELGSVYFDKACIFVPLLILLLLASWISNVVKNKVTGAGAGAGAGAGKKADATEKKKGGASQGGAASSGKTKKKKTTAKTKKSD